jgi:hypothetical protein
LRAVTAYFEEFTEIEELAVDVATCVWVVGRGRRVRERRGERVVERG